MGDRLLGDTLSEWVFITSAYAYLFTHFALTFTIISQPSQKKMSLSQPLHHPISRLSRPRLKKALLVLKSQKRWRNPLLNRLPKRLPSNHPPNPLRSLRSKSPIARSPMVRRRNCRLSKVIWRRRSRGRVRPVSSRWTVVAREAVVQPWTTRVCGPWFIVSANSTFCHPVCFGLPTPACKSRWRHFELIWFAWLSFIMVYWWSR